eukprot:scaffold30872_cov32-Prasinocladus_malaysianus.AAC.1
MYVHAHANLPYKEACSACDFNVTCCPETVSVACKTSMNVDEPPRGQLAGIEIDGAGVKLDNFILAVGSSAHQARRCALRSLAYR